MACDLSGEWKSAESDGTDELLAALGVTDPNITAAAKNSIEVITQSAESLHVVYKVADNVLKETDYVFGREFSDPDPAGNMWKCTGSWKGDVLEIDANNEEKGWKMTVTRTIENGDMVVNRKLVQGGSTIVSTGRFKKV